VILIKFLIYAAMTLQIPHNNNSMLNSLRTIFAHGITTHQIDRLENLYDFDCNRMLTIAVAMHTVNYEN